MNPFIPFFGLSLLIHVLVILVKGLFFVVRKTMGYARSLRKPTIETKV